MNRGIATFTLDTGAAPRWLFHRMVKLGREIIYVLIDEYGPDEFVKRIADPVWFQSLGTVLAFDWNASGLTTVLTGALKEAIKGQEKDLGIFICGGKGKTSRKTPDQIVEWSESINLSESATNTLVRNSKMSAKVDSALVQDGYQLYHHTFFFTPNGSWSVVQQGMNTNNKTARRYHWHDTLQVQNSKCKVQSSNNKINNSHIDFVDEPHTGIASQRIEGQVLNMVAKDSSKTRNISTDLVKAGYKQIYNDIQLLRKHSNAMSRMMAVEMGGEQYTMLQLNREDFYHHQVGLEDLTQSKYLEKILQKVTEEQPENYEHLVEIKGVGPKTIRSLALVAEVIYGAAPSYKDPARYSFAHGGKDMIPFPVDRYTYDTTIEMLKNVVRKSKISPFEKDKILRRM